jgi:DNA repair protein RadC
MLPAIHKQNIKAWAHDDRPREKLQIKGTTSLSDAELIAILLRSGSQDETAVDLAKRILNDNQYNLVELGQRSIEDLCNYKGIGEAKAISLIASLELGRRRRLSEALQRKQIVRSVHSFEVLQPLLGDLPHEEFWILLLNAANLLIGYRRISQGGLNATVVDARSIFKEALLANASSIILGHNHPSGKVLPSKQDKLLTQNLLKVGEALGLHVLDHIIIGANRYYSFVDEGLM